MGPYVTDAKVHKVLGLSLNLDIARRIDRHTTGCCGQESSHMHWAGHTQMDEEVEGWILAVLLAYATRGKRFIPEGGYQGVGKMILGGSKYCRIEFDSHRIKKVNRRASRSLRGDLHPSCSAVIILVADLGDVIVVSRRSRRRSSWGWRRSQSPTCLSDSFGLV